MTRCLKEKIENDNIQGVKLDYYLIRGIASEEIIAKSMDYNPDVIIIGTRGHGEKENDLIGSVTSKIIEDTQVPVLVIPEDSLYQGISTVNVMYTPFAWEMNGKSGVSPLLKKVQVVDLVEYKAGEDFDVEEGFTAAQAPSTNEGLNDEVPF